MEENRIGVCMICEQQRSGGIHIVSVFICDQCSSEIVRTDVEDRRYPFFVKQMRKVFHTGKSGTSTYM
ncbi:sigma factor G inhibitor Gin [Paenibacillus hexagrammi]|uniref:Sigma factor G inhibitor Gin n=1 Tax=Paenibacillus hexagrammi TaxID=2908839 RepID=A0ABY3SIT8_9BACL|nr:sigma factor G inhibitor Gin [Paenibacillus sp. YPD9-1]UJF33144.1 sigma factor G inhibitor Gin [Paenibacillus sp. YPD9-1]